jgi:hypothetical protein
MARTVTITQLTARIRKRADMVSATGFYTDADILEVINEVSAELYDTLVESYQNYFSTTANLSLTPGTVSYSLPADFYKLISADRDNGGGNYTTLFMYNEMERNSTLGTSAATIPTMTVRLRYIPNPPVYTAGSDTIDGVAGWDSMIVTDAAISLLDSEESDTTALEKRRARQMARITVNAQNRDITMPGRVGDMSVFQNQFLRDAVRYRIYGNKIEFVSVSYLGV